MVASDRHALSDANAPEPNSSITSFLFPLFASYKALKTSDPAQLTPWLMYWVVLACALLFESWTEWILVWYVHSVTCCSRHTNTTTTATEAAD